jgi:dipeptidyl aminopeptidase/acylaminoacyl peptidase
VTEPLIAEALVYDVPLPGDPRVSPDGRQLAFTLRTTNRETRRWHSQVWVCDTDGGNPRSLLTAANASSCGRWSPDGTRLAVVTAEADGSAVRIVTLDRSGDDRVVVRHRDGIDDLAWSPDGTRLAYCAAFDPANPDDRPPAETAAPPVRVVRRIDYKTDVLGVIGDVRQHVFVVDLASGARRRVTTDLLNHRSPTWAPDGRCLAVHQPSRSEWGSSRLLIVDCETGQQRDAGLPGGVVETWAWSPRGDRLLFSGDVRPRYQDDWYLFDVASGEARRLTDDLAVDPNAQPVWLDERTVLFSALSAGASGLYLLDTTSGAIERAHTWQAVASGSSVDVARTVLVQTYTSFDRFREIVVFDLKTMRSRIVTGYSSALLDAMPPADWERFAVQRGELTIESWLLRPTDHAPGRRYPVVLTVHGGPHGCYGYRFSQIHQLLASNGFLVILPNPRGSTSYGRHFTQLIIDDWMGEDYRDLLAVLEAVLARPDADPARIGIWGYSYGGHMTAWAIGQSERFRAAVCGAPSFDMISQYGTSTGDYDYGDIAWGGPPWENRDWYLARSPSTFAHRARTPTLIIHGEGDEGVPIGQTEEMFTTLLKVGCEVEYARYPGEGHAFIDPGVGAPEHQVDYLDRSLHWFKRFLGDPTPAS